MSALVAAALAAVGVALLITGQGDASGSDASRRHGSVAAQQVLERVSAWMDRNGIEDTTPGHLLAVTAAVALLGGAGVWLGLGSALLALLGALGAAAIPPALWRRRGAAVRRASADAWPWLLEELRVRTGSLGRPLPQALLEVGLGGPPELQPAFRAAAREWSLTTDFERMTSVLKARLADPTADAVCETLLVAHEVSGDVDGRLVALIEDRRTDLRQRHEAAARQAGARFARWFVVIVPAGMGLAGLRLGDGAAAFSSLGGQLAAGTAVLMVAGCWFWAGRIMRLPAERRVFEP